MSQSYLEVTFRHGRPLAAYYYLARAQRQSGSRTERFEPGLVVDFDEHGNPLGVEITAPSRITLDALNRVLVGLGQEPLQDADIAPLKAA